MEKYLRLFILSLLFTITSCSDSNSETPIQTDDFIRAADISFLPEIESVGTVFYNGNVAEDMITTLKKKGCNTIRIRLWNNPASGHSGMTEVKNLAQRVKAAGMKVWLTVHYSDTWADPGAQTIPLGWQSLSFADLKTEVSDYTSTVLSEIHPDIFQIGNEINDGFLWPQGRLTQNEQQFTALLSAASTTIRTQSPNTKIMIHYAGINGSKWFFDKVSSVDYDYIGLSYYPMYHGKVLSNLKKTIDDLGATFGKKVIIAETAYPFTLGYNDFTNNVVGLEEQLIPTIPATPEGQKYFLQSVKNLVKDSEYGAGLSYWGGEWVAFRGPKSTNGSSYENQALYDFDNKALPIMDVFGAD